MQTLIRVLTILAILSVKAWADPPAVIWVSQPVEPGEAVMVFGGPWTDVEAVELAGPKKTTVVPLRVTKDCVTFVYPAGWPRAAFTARVVDKTGVAETRINAADVWWLQGDAGKSASPGGWVRIFGRSIGYGKKASVELRGGRKPVKLRATEFDLYSMRIDLPENLAAGEYEVMVKNGLDRIAVSAGKISVQAQQAFWKDKIFNVVDYGARANDRNDDSHAIQAALADIAANGGGILYFPRGRFGMTGTIELPPNTLLRGETEAWTNGRLEDGKRGRGPGKLPKNTTYGGNQSTNHPTFQSSRSPSSCGALLSQIYWIDKDDPQKPLISGTHDFGIEEIFLASGNFTAGIQAQSPAPEDTWTSENILLRRVRTRFLDTDTMSKEEAARRLTTQASTVSFHGSRNVTITGCDFYTTKNGMSAMHLEYSVVRGNRFSGARTGAYIGGRQVIFEDNDCRGFTFSFGPGSRNYYFARNQLGGVRGDGDRETFTFDGGRTTHNGPVASTRKQGVTLPPGAWRDGAGRWIGETVCVIGGKGAGQMRIVTKINGRDVELDKPWDIVPDTKSHIVIGLERKNLLLIDNHMGDGNPFQLYGSVANVVLAGNMIEGNSMHAFGMSKGGSPEPSWFVQFLGNRLEDGNTVRGPWSYMVPAADSYIGFFDRGIVKPLTYPQARVGIMRGNVLNGNAYLYAGRRVENMLVENNVVRNSNTGVKIQSKGAVLRGNTFEYVIQPYSLNDGALLAPAERLVASLGAVETTLGDRIPATWAKLVDEAETLRDKSLPVSKSIAGVQDILVKAVRQVSVTMGDKPIPSSVVQALFGLNLHQPTPWFLSKIASGAVKNCKCPLNSVYPEWALPATLSGRAEGFEGWSVRVDVSDQAVPGKKVAVNLWLTRSDSIPTVFTLPVEYTLAGDGWKLHFKQNYSYNDLPVTEFLAVGPFKNSSGKGIDTEVHPPEINLDVTQSYDTCDGKRPWAEVTADAKGKVNLASIFKHTELMTAHVVAVVRATRPTRVNVSFGSHFSNLAFVNGRRIGSSSRRPGPAFVELNEGDNLVHLISSNGSGAWPVAVKLSVLDSVKPGELQVVPAKELRTSPLLVSGDGRLAEGKDLPNSLGIDWKLVYNDTFDRLRLGSGWSCTSPSWMPQTPIIRDGALRSEAGWGFLTWETAVKAPVRIECDAVFKGNMMGVYLCPEGLAWRSFWYGKGGQGHGRGYCLSLGWHDAKNNRIRRDGKTVLLDEKNPVLKEGQACHMVAQFIPPRCQIYVDGKLIMEYEDKDFLPGLNRIGLFQLGASTFDNVRIYTGK